MLCREVKRRLNERGWERDPDLKRHLEECPSCAQLAHTDTLLNRGFERMRRTNEPTTPLAEVRAKVEAPSRPAVQERDIMAMFTSIFKRRPRLAAATVLAVVTILVVTLIPFSYSRTVGYSVNFSNINTAQLPLDQIERAMGALGYGDISVVAMPTSIHFRSLPSRSAAREAAVAVMALGGITDAPDIQPITEKVSGSLYAQALEKRHSISIDAAGKSDAEIQAEIQQKLAEAGFTVNELSVTTNADGERQIKVGISKESGEGMEQGQLELRIKGDSGTVDCALPIPIKVETEGKTDEQIISEVKAKLAEQGQPDADVTVTTEPDGKKRIEVRVEKEHQTP